MIIFYILYVVRFWGEGGQRSLAYRDVHQLPSKREFGHFWSEVSPKSIGSSV